jgi:hypothetical protein
VLVDSDVIDGPQDDARSTAPTAEIKKTVPDKPIKIRGQYASPL